MFKFLPYVLKTLWRHRARTLLTVSGSAVALFVFCFVGSVQEGLRDMQRRQEGKRTLISFQANKFCPATSFLPQDYDRKIRQIPGVRSVVPIQVYTNNCRASLDVVVFYGLPAAMLRQVRAFELVEGNWSEFEGHQDAGVAGRAVAQRRGLKVGDKFSIGGLAVTIAGIYAADDPAEENYVYAHLDFLQRRKSASLVGTVTQLEVWLDAQADADLVCQAIDDLFRGGPVATDTRPKGVFQAQSLGDLAQVVNLAQYVGLACLGLVFALVATTTVMSVQDRLREYAVLQTIGFTEWRVFCLVLTESAALSTGGGLLGIGAGLALLAWGGFALGADAVTVAFRPSLSLAALSLAIALGVGILAGIPPALQAARVVIVQALRGV